MKLSELTGALGNNCQVYGCGPERLLDELEHLSANWPDQALHIEHFNTSDTLLDPKNEHGFRAVLKDSGLTLDIRPDQTLFQALSDAGIDINCDCQEGLCGSCEAQVVEGEIDHRDKVLSKAERAEGKRMMTCCSRAKNKSITLAL